MGKKKDDLVLLGRFQSQEEAEEGKEASNGVQEQKLTADLYIWKIIHLKISKGPFFKTDIGSKEKNVIFLKEILLAITCFLFDTILWFRK